jgi:hypothetical protein
MQKMVLGTSLSGFNPGKLRLFVAKLSRGRHDNINIAGRVIFPKT